MNLHELIPPDGAIWRFDGSCGNGCTAYEVNSQHQDCPATRAALNIPPGRAVYCECNACWATRINERISHYTVSRHGLYICEPCRQDHHPIPPRRP